MIIIVLIHLLAQILPTIHVSKMSVKRPAHQVILPAQMLDLLVSTALEIPINA